ncbi:MAG TPA: LamG domain-containing protein [Chthoniobacteraceae bacterium]|nr:LamG domain-containing protein [Chthoniobacteraceae bacterium]
MKIFPAWFACMLLLCGVLLAQSDAPSPSPSPAALPAPDAPLQLTFQLTDGTRVTGTPLPGRFKMTTKYAEVEIPFARLRTFVFDDDRTVRVSLKNDDQFTGRVRDASIVVKTATGQVTIPFARVRQIRLGDGVMPDGLVLYYKFDKDEGGRATDFSGMGNDGKLQGAPAYTKEGKVFGGMNFSGDGDAVIVGNPDSLHLQDFTIMAWIKRGDTDKVSNTTPYGEIFGYGAGGYVVGLEQDGYIYLSQADIQMSAISTFQIHDKLFHHVVVVKQGDKATFYLDRVPTEELQIAPQGDFVFKTDAAVGARSDDLHKCFIGTIDEVAVFKRALGADEVKAVYESQK